MDQSMTELIQQVKQSELQADAQIKELISVRKKCEDLKNDTKSIHEKYVNLRNSQATNLVELTKLEFDAKLLRKTDKLLSSETLPEKKKNNETEKSALEDIRNDIWQKRRRFCERARDFNDKYSFLSQTTMPANLKKLFSNQVLPTPDDQGEFCALSAEVSSLERQLNELMKKQSDCDKRQLEVEEELHQVTNEHDFANNLKKAQTDLTCVQQQINKIKAQCVNVQKDINYKIMLMKDGNHTASARPRYALTKQPPSQLFNNYPKYTKFYNSSLNTSSGAQAIIRASDRLDPTRDYSTPKSYGGWHQGLPMHSARTLQGEKGAREQTGPSVRKLFVPKTPSLMSQRLLTSQKSSLALEQTFLNISRQESAPVPSTETLAGNVLMKEEKPWDGPPSAKRQAVNAGPNGNPCVTARVFKPYIA